MSRDSSVSPLLMAGTLLLMMSIAAAALVPCVTCPSRIHYIRVWHANLGTRTIRCDGCGRDTAAPIPRVSLLKYLSYRLSPRSA